MNATYFKTGQALPLPNAAIAPQVLCPSTAPLVLLPVRLETRFFPQTGVPTELRIRVFPEQIHIDSHQPELTTEERTWGTNYWKQDWAAVDDNGRGDAWRVLANRYGAARAAWIARTLKPTNIAQRTVKPQPAPVFPTLPPVAPGGEAVWRTAPKARLLPDRWIAMAHAAGKLALTASSKPVRKPLAVGPDPQAPALDAKTEAAVRAGTALPVDPGMKWLIDYDEAELAGMAFRMPLPPEIVASGIDSLVVFGVSATAPADSATQLADLLDAHSYTDGLQFVPFGAPTNNTEDQRAAFTTDDPDHQRSFRNEVTRDPAKSPNATRLGRALGLPDARVIPTLGHVDGADGDHDLDLQSMNTALWPVGWGYFLSNMVGPQTGLGAASLDWARTHFLTYVRAGGPLPSLRVGRQPYGVLPVSSLDLWAPDAATTPQDTWLPPTLAALREQVWRPVLGQVSRLGLRKDQPDPDADFADSMAVDGVSSGYAMRRVLGGQYLRHLHAIQNLGLPAAAIEAQTKAADGLLGVLGVSKDAAKRPRLANAFYEPGAFDVSVPLIQAGDLPEGAPAPSYIQDLLKPTTIQALSDTARNTSLFEALLRHGLLREYAIAAARIYATTGHDLGAALLDPELVDMVDLPRDGFILKPPVHDQHWLRQLTQVATPITGADNIRAFLDKLRTYTHATVKSLGDFRVALDRLSKLEAARLEVLLQGTLDLSSHRLDAWITSMATKRLATMRNAAAVGQYVGAYGWVENLHPADPATLVTTPPAGETGQLFRPADESGFIHAPSTTHAAAAALLRNAHLGPRGKPQADDPFAIDLSSRRVREASRLMDGVRSGQPLGALLGYRLERRLQDLKLSRLIAPLRAAAPLVIRDRGDAASAGDAKLLGANNVVDGLTLAQAYKAAPDTYLKAVALPKASDDDRAAAQREIQAVLDDIDGLSDALTAETAYQLARGNNARLGATLAAVAQGAAPPPELEVVRTPRSGISLTHRVAVLIDAALPAVAGWPAPATSPLAAAEGALNTWASRLLGDPRKIRCTVERLADDGKTVAQTVVFPLSELNLTPLDVVYGLDDTAGSAPAGASQSHLEQLVTYNAQRRAGGTGAAANLRIQTARPANLAAGEITFSDALEQARAVRRLLEQARGLRPEDLAPPERTSQAAIDVAGLLARVKAGEDALTVLHNRLNGQVKAGPAPAADALRADLLALGAFGIRPAAPAVAVGDTPAIRDQLLRQAAALLAVSGPRLARAAELRLAAPAADPGARCTQLLEYGKAVFGPRFVLLPKFTCDAPAAAELKAALAASTAQQGGDPLAVHAWFARSAQVREPAAALGRCLRGAEMLGAGDRLALSVAQLPFDAAERWVGLPALPNTTMPPSKLSIAVQAPGPVNTATALAGLLVDEWVEVIPGKTETTALTFQFNPPNAFAPQAVLVATPPKPGQDWTTETLRQVLLETLDLAKLRGVDPSLLGAAAQYLPGVYLPFNAAGHVVSTDAGPLTL